MSTHDSPLKSTPHQHEPSSAPAYESNPFNLLVNGTVRLFNTNQTAALIIVGLSIAASFLQIFGQIVSSLLDSSSGSSSFTADSSGAGLTPLLIALIVVIVLVVILVCVAIGALIQAFIAGMLAYVVLCTIRGQKASFSEGISLVGKHYWQLVVASVMVQIKVILGILLFIVPGIRASYRYDLIYVRILDKGTKAGQAMKDLKAITKGRIIEFFGVKTLASLVPIIGSLVTMGGQVEQYRQLTQSYNNPAYPRTNVHWLNYIGFVFVAFVVLFVASIFAVIIALAINNN